MRSARQATIMAGLFSGAIALAAAQTSAPSGDWPSAGSGIGGSKYSALTQITPSNVSRLQTAWTYDLGTRSDFSMTPLAVKNVLYFGHTSNIVALKADTGTELWKFDMKTVPEIAAVGIPSAGGRGLSY